MATTHPHAYPAAPHVDYHVWPHDAPYSFTQWTPGSVSRWLGRCGQCQTPRRVDLRQDIRLTWRWSEGDKAYFSTRLYEYAPLTPGMQYQPGKPGYVLVRCLQGCVDQWGEAVWFAPKRIEGSFKDGIACNAKCVHATSPRCECQCAGDNHGSIHA